MASITNYLNNILSAVYGRDVRQSIYDSINAINTQVETYSEAEEERVNAEKERAKSESGRVSDEDARIQSEKLREEAEEARQTAYRELEDTVNQLINDLEGLKEGEVTFLKVYPVGSIYFSVSDTDPGTLFGGTWETWGSGRVPVGVDAETAAFAAVEQTGGESEHQLVIQEMPSHAHYVEMEESGIYESGYGLTNANPLFEDEVMVMSNSAVASKFTGGDKAHNNLQPYITCYMWKRTA